MSGYMYGRGGRAVLEALCEDMVNDMRVRAGSPCADPHGDRNAFCR